MKTGYRLVVFGIALMVSGALACEGPTGPQGEQGPQGTQGPQGEQGPQGVPGNANVVADTLTLTNGDWIWNSIFWLGIGTGSSSGYFSRYVDLDVPALTEEILYAGEVRVYMEHAPSPSPGVLTPLPLTFTHPTYSRNYFYEISVGQIRLHYFHTRNDPAATIPSPADATIPTRLYKWLVIEGTLASQMTDQGVDMDDPDEVTRFLESRGISVQTGAASLSSR